MLMGWFRSRLELGYGLILAGFLASPQYFLLRLTVYAIYSPIDARLGRVNVYF